MRSHIDIFTAETTDESEWSLVGWAFVSGSMISSGCLMLNGVMISPISCNWPRRDVLEAFPSECPSENVGFMAHIFLPSGISPGDHTFELLFFDANDIEIGRIQQHFSLSKKIANVISTCTNPLDAPEDSNTREYLDNLERNLLGLSKASGPELQLRRDGRDWPSSAHTMIGLDRLHHLRLCAETIMRENVPGDFIETGVWRGGACIMMRGVLHAFHNTSRNVWVADSFKGLPRPNDEKYPADVGDKLYTFKELAIPFEQVRENFAHYGLLDAQVKFLKGWFSETLPTAPIHQLAILRLDGDMYESTMDALTHLYPKLSPGGFCIIDDYGCIPACRAAVRDYRKSHGINEPMSMIDWTGAFWRKESAVIEAERPLIHPLSPNHKVLKGSNILYSNLAMPENQKSNPGITQLAEGLPLGRLALREPHYLHPASAWLEHIPFAFWLVEHHRPGTIVELGVLTGPSFCAFCQAVTELGLDTRCFGVDTFKGDLNTGFYGSEVLEKLRAYHDPLYAKFSSIIPSTFDEALHHFTDASIDVLHIDGCHTYEAVKHDFESWLPKLSSRAIVLFHDTNVRAKNFGVFQLWAELQASYPSFEFFHEHGLGVLAFGNDQTPALLNLFSSKSEQQVSIRDRFSFLGSRLRLRVKADTIPALEAELLELHKNSASKNVELAALKNQQALLQQQQDLLQNQQALLQQNLSTTARSLSTVTQGLHQTKVELAESKEAFLTLHLQYDQLQSSSQIRNQVYGASEAERQQSALKLANDFKKLQDTSIRKSFKSRLVAAFPWFKGRKLRRLCRQIERSGLFDPAYYCSQLPARFKVNNPLVHYLRIGWKAGLSPHRLFNVAWYQQSYARKLKGREPLTDFLQGGWKKKRRPHPLFDVEWYVQRYPESAEKDRNPLSDYIRYAVRKKRWPQPLFDGAWYVNQYGAQLAPSQTPLEHYLEGKNPLKCRPNPLLDTKWYVKQYFGSSKPNINPLLHYLEVGAKCGLEPNPLFDPSWYVHEYPSVAKSGMNPLAHYIHEGAAKNFKPCPLFESGWYARQYQNFIKDKVNPLAHYLIHGKKERLNPHPLFDASQYLKLYSDVAAAGIEPLRHYLSIGWKEKRNPHALFDITWYFEKYADIAVAGLEPLNHFMTFGWKEGRAPSPLFDSPWYLLENPDVEAAGINPLIHFLYRGWSEGRLPNPRPTAREELQQHLLTHGITGACDDWDDSRIPSVPAELCWQARLIAAGGTEPLISLVMPVYCTPLKLLERAIQSVIDQEYPVWELCIVDDGSNDEPLRQHLQKFVDTDARIKVTYNSDNRGISKATNDAIAMCQGGYVALLDHDDELTSDALGQIVVLLAEHPDTDVIYTDQDKIDLAGNRYEPFHKPAWSPVFLLGVMYVGHLLVVRRSILQQTGGCDTRFDKVQDFEMLLRISEKTQRIRHLPKILYHWRAAPDSLAASSNAKSNIEELQVAAVSAYFERLGIAAVPRSNPLHPHRILIEPAGEQVRPLVSIIIPSTAKTPHLAECLASIMEKSTYKEYEILLTMQKDSLQSTQQLENLDLAKQMPSVRLLEYDFPFNYSKVNNYAASQSAGQVLLFLNDDTQVTTPSWLEVLLTHLYLPNVGVVGAKLLYPDRTVQHAGVVLGFRGTADHVMRDFPGDCDGYFGSLSASREVAAVTGACLMTRASTYQDAGGMKECYSSIYQDVDLCLSIRQSGLSVLSVANAELIHHESTTRGSDYDRVDREILIDRWRDQISADPFYNIHFTRKRHDYKIRRSNLPSGSLNNR